MILCDQVPLAAVNRATDMAATIFTNKSNSLRYSASIGGTQSTRWNKFSRRKDKIDLFISKIESKPKGFYFLSTDIDVIKKDVKKVYDELAALNFENVTIEPTKDNSILFCMIKDKYEIYIDYFLDNDEDEPDMFIVKVFKEKKIVTEFKKYYQSPTELYFNITKLLTPKSQDKNPFNVYLSGNPHTQEKLPLYYMPA